MNKEAGSFPSSYDLKIPGTSRAVENMEVEFEADVGARFSSPQPEEKKGETLD